MKRILFSLLLLFSITLSAQVVSSTVSYSQSADVCTFPTILAGTAVQQETVNATSHPLTMPSGIGVGNLLLAIIGTDGTEAPTINTGVSGVNWTIEDVDNTYNTGQIIWKIAEVGDALTLTTTASEKTSAIIYRISCFDTDDPVKSTHTAGNSANADPPSITPDYGAVNYLVIAVAITNDATVCTVAPADFSNLLTTDITTSSAPTNTADREYNSGDAYDPAVFIHTSVTWEAFTLLINPQ